MRLAQHYSHQNGFEWLMHHKPHIWKEVEYAIKHVDADSAEPRNL